MHNTTKSPAELKAKKKEIKSLFTQLIIAFALISTSFDFETLMAKVIFATVIIITTLVCTFMLIRWVKDTDEYEFNINAKACFVAMYSSLLYLPLQYLSELGLIPEIQTVFFFMSI